jgi:hypothetical protein
VVRHGEVEIIYVKSIDNIADIFTKGLDQNSFLKCRRSLMVQDQSGDTSDTK